MTTNIERIEISEPLDTLEPRAHHGLPRSEPHDDDGTSDDLPPGIRWIDPRRDAVSIAFTEPEPNADRARMVAVWIALAISIGLWAGLGFAARAVWRMLTG